MINKKLLLCLLVLYIFDYTFTKECGSCVMLQQCPEALNLNNKNPLIEQKVQEANCGTRRVDDKEYPMVCCSDLINVPDSKGDEEADIETHRNIALLPETCGEINADRILAGYPNLYSYPWMTLIAHVVKNKNGKNDFQCGGAIINSRYILTAAHCVVNKTIAGVRVGEYDLSTREDCVGDICESHIQDVRVAKAIAHGDFKIKPNVQDDIALLRLKNPIDLSFKNAAPICLPIFNNLRNISINGKHATVAGWGITGVYKESSVIRMINIPINTDDECRKYYNRNSESTIRQVINKKICAGTSSMDSCKGDFGGPLMLENEYKGVNRMIQFGIASYGICNSSSPGVYTDVRKYVKWILDNIEV